MAISKIISSSISDNTVVAADVGPNAITASELADDAVDTAAIANDAITTAKVADDQITTALIVNDAVTGAKIENNPTIAGNLTVSGTSTLTGNSTVGGTLTSTGAITASGGIANAGTITAGTLGDNVVMNSGSIVKTTSSSYYNQMTSNVSTTYDYSVNRTTSNTTSLGSHTHTTKIANPRLTVYFSGQLGFQTYGTGNPILWISIFVNDVWKTGIRSRITHNSNYSFMESLPLMMSETITQSAGYSYVIKIRCALSGNFDNNTGLGGTPLVGLGHSGFDNSDGHRAYIIVQESVA